MFNFLNFFFFKLEEGIDVPINVAEERVAGLHIKIAEAQSVALPDLASVYALDTHHGHIYSLERLVGPLRHVKLFFLHRSTLD